MTTFDAPDREKCTARRTITNTPLQALVLLNDPTYVEAARALAERMMNEGGNDAGEPHPLRLPPGHCAPARRSRKSGVLRRQFEAGTAAVPADDQDAAQKLLSSRRIASRRQIRQSRNWPPGPPWPA